MTQYPRLRHMAAASSLALSFVLAGCANQNPDGRVSSPGVGTAAGAGAGALAGRLVAGGNDNILAIGAGALIGGLAGNMLVDRPEDKARAVDQEIARNSDAQRDLDYQRQSQIQRAQVDQELQEQRLYEQWKAQQTAVSYSPVTSSSQISEAQRLLIAHGYLGGPADGVYGPNTANAVRAFQTSNGDLANGQITPTLISQLKATL